MSNAKSKGTQPKKGGSSKGGRSGKGAQSSKGAPRKQVVQPPSKRNAQAKPQPEPQPELQPYQRLIIVGSTRVQGRSAGLAQQLFDACLEDCPDDGVSLVSVASLHVGPCIGCNACQQGACALEDDMDQVLDLVENADEVIMVCPVYFAGPPAPAKALLDRLQPFFWTDARHGELRPLTLHIIGEGHDPFGYDPLVGCVSSAFYCAGFELEQIFDWVGKLDAHGQILDEPDVYVLSDADADDSAEDAPGVADADVESADVANDADAASAAADA